MDPDVAYPPKVCEFEELLIRARRAEAHVPQGDAAIGLALSGGGIRSATFSLGILQALARLKLLRRVDYLSTVSGGGYIGSSLGALFAREKLPERWKLDGVTRMEQVEAILSDSSHDYLRWLREHGRYLSPNGAGDLLLAAAVLLRNWVAVQVTLAVALGSVVLLQLAIRLSLGASGVAADWPFRAEFVNGFYVHGVWWSPWIASPLVPLIVGVIPFGWAYWLVISRSVYNPWFPPALLVIGLFGLESSGVWWLWTHPPDAKSPAAPWLWPLFGVAVTTGFTLIWFLVVRDWKATLLEWVARLRGVGKRTLLTVEDRKARAQRWLSRGLEISLQVTTVLVAFALVDSLGQTVYGIGTSHVAFRAWFAAVIPAVGVVVSAAPTVMSVFPSLSQDARPRGYMTAISSVAAGVILVAFLALTSVGAHAIAWRGEDAPSAVTNEYRESMCRTPARDACDEPPTAVPELKSDESGDRAIVAWAGFAIGLIVTISIGHTWTFLNQSTHAPLYAARLRRAYVGASNPERFSDGKQSVRLELPGDEIRLDHYAPDSRGGPLHIVNVTVNETVGAESQLEQRDRKGMNLAFGPAGLSLGVKHHAVWAASESRGSFAAGLRPIEPEFPVFQTKWQGESREPAFYPEALPVGRLVAISGAAFTTGLGARTSLAMSLLLGLLNIRLGHWWLSGVDPRWRTKFGDRSRLALLHWSRVFPVHTYLLNELLAQFPGTARENWYLSDGGHFENTACYELIRRKLPLIIVCDNGEDPECDLTDLGQLVRKARLDFGCEIRFLTQTEVTRVVHSELAQGEEKCVGTVQELSRLSGPLEKEPPRYRRSDVYATLAIATHSDQSRSVIVWIKPGLNGSEPQDVIEYAVANGSYPQQPTADQFFDEAQWESYRKLGSWIGESLFRTRDGRETLWQPSSLDPKTLLERLDAL
jgi:hypothetical protein